MRHAVDGHIHCGGEHLPSDLSSSAAGTCYNCMDGQCEQSCMPPRTDTKVHEDHSWEGQGVPDLAWAWVSNIHVDVAAASRLHRSAAAYHMYTC